jgi:hypothetical protein
VRLSGLASDLAIAVRPAGSAEAPALKGTPTLEGPTWTMRGVPFRWL